MTRMCASLAVLIICAIGGGQIANAGAVNTAIKAAKAAKLREMERLKWERERHYHLRTGDINIYRSDPNPPRSRPQIIIEEDDEED